MIIYKVNGKYYYKNLELAIAKAKDVVKSRCYIERYAGDTTMNWKITQGKNKGYCVKLLGHYDDNNPRLMQCVIETIETKEK